MKILLLTEASAAGVGRHVIDLAGALLASGHDCHILYGVARMDERFRAGIAKFTNTLALQVERSPALSDLTVALQVRRYLRENGPFDILHAHSTKAGLLLRFAAFGFSGAVLYTPHAPLTMNPALPLPVRAALAVFECVLSVVTDRVIAVSKEEAEHLARCGLPRKKISIVPNGLSESGAEPGPGPNVARPVCIGFLGRLSPQKNAGLLLEAFALAFERNSSVSLAIAGTGPELAGLQGSAARLGIAGRVSWLGARADDVMHTFDVFALPSLYEGMPYVLLEALAAGVPVVATAVGGVRSVIEHGREGYVVPPGNIGQFASCLQMLASSAPLRRRCSLLAKAKASQFTLRKMAVDTVAVYQIALDTVKHPRFRVRTSPAVAD